MERGIGMGESARNRGSCRPRVGRRGESKGKGERCGDEGVTRRIITVACESIPAGGADRGMREGTCKLEQVGEAGPATGRSQISSHSSL